MYCKYCWKSYNTKTLFKDAIKTLVLFGNLVYIYVEYNITLDAILSEIFDLQDYVLYDKLVSPLIEKIKGLKTTGIILGEEK